MSADTQKAKIELSIQALGHVEVIEASAEVHFVTVLVLRTVEVHPQSLAAEDIFVDPKANFGRKTKE